MSAQGKVRTSYEFSPKNKVRLTELKLDLKRKGLIGVSEATILEMMIASARLDDLEAKFTEAQKALRAHRRLLLAAAAAEKAKKPRRRR